ncbi:MAG: hypothetical protein ACI9N9_000072 [Enterobacterales bacterium]|jgi:hypothetical protein
MFKKEDLGNPIDPELAKYIKVHTAVDERKKIAGDNYEAVNKVLYRPDRNITEFNHGFIKLIALKALDNDLANEKLTKSFKQIRNKLGALKVALLTKG